MAVNAAVPNPEREVGILSNHTVHHCINKWVPKTNMLVMCELHLTDYGDK